MSLLAGLCMWLWLRFGRRAGAENDRSREHAPEWWPVPQARIRERADRLMSSWGYDGLVWIDDDELEDLEDDMATNRCSSCGANWPQQPRFRVCPDCGEKTDPVWNDNPMDLDEALERLDAAKVRADAERTSRLNHEKFERFYAEREAQQAKAFEDLVAAARIE